MDFFTSYDFLSPKNFQPSEKIAHPCPKNNSLFLLRLDYKLINKSILYLFLIDRLPYQKQYFLPFTESKQYSQQVNEQNYHKPFDIEQFKKSSHRDLYYFYPHIKHIY